MDFTTKKIILFDLDGTITDSGEGIINSVKYMLEAYGINEYDEAIFKKFIGPPLFDTVKELLGFDDSKAHEAVSKFREYFRKTGIYENKLYAGIGKMLKRLVKEERKIILATSKAEVFAEQILKHFNIQQYFWVVAGSELDGTRIKKGEVIRYALGKADIAELSNVVMVGDRNHDIFGAKEIGIDSIGVLYGYGSYDELENAGATLIVETVEDLEKVLIG